MATRSSIAFAHPDGSVSSIYCHNDGYLRGGVGETLFHHYNTADKVQALIALGSLSSLGRHIDPLPSAPSAFSWRVKGEITTHTFDEPQEGVTVAYVRDRGDRPLYIDQHHSIEAYKQSDSLQGQDYLFHDGKWHHEGNNEDGWGEVTAEMVDTEPEESEPVDEVPVTFITQAQIERGDVQVVLVVSTVHMDKEDDRTLERTREEDRPWLCTDMNPGWLLNIVEDDEDTAAEVGISQALRRNVQIARSKGYTHLRLDPDANEHGEMRKGPKW